MLNSLTVRALLRLVLVGTTALLLVITAIVWVSVGSISDAANEMGQGKDVVADILPPPLYAIEAELTVHRLEDAEAGEVPALLDKLASLKKDYDTRNAYWETAPLDPEVKKSLLGDQKRAADEFWKLAAGDFTAAVKQNDRARIRQLGERIHKIYQDHRQGVDGTVKIASTYADNTLQALQDTSGRVRLVVTLLAGIGGLGMAGFLALVAAEILRRLGGEPLDMQVAARRIASGDLTERLAVGTGDTVSLLATIADMQSHLRETINQSRQAAESVAAAARQLAVSSHQVAQSSSQQSEASSSMAASVEQVTVSISTVADNATSAHGIAGETGSLSAEGRTLVQDTIEGIHQIAESVTRSSEVIRTLGEQSSQISSIVNVIKEIADQTNLLALNAAIEAARAGEQGRGFAVVADEVRKLAERTTASTQEIAAMISAIQLGTQNAVQQMEEGRTQVNDGVQMAAKTGEAMARIQAGMEKVLRAVEEISGALREQSAASTQMAQDTEKIAQMTEENNNAVTEVSRSATRLQDLAASMMATVSRFRL